MRGIEQTDFVTDRIENARFNAEIEQIRYDFNKEAQAIQDDFNRKTDNTIRNNKWELTAYVCLYVLLMFALIFIAVWGCNIERKINVISANDTEVQTIAEKPRTITPEYRYKRADLFTFANISRRLSEENLTQESEGEDNEVVEENTFPNLEFVEYNIDWEDRYEEPEIYIPENNLENFSSEQTYLGEFKLTAYCPCYECSEGYGRNTATGTMATAGRTIGVNPTVIPYGTVVIINGHEYVAEDTGGGIGNYHIDVFCDTHEEALNFGVQYADVYLRN